MRRRVRMAFLMVVLLMAAASCQRRPFAEWNTKVDLQLAVKTEIVNEPSIPELETMRLGMYHTVTGDIQHTDFVAPTGGVIHPKPGTYHMLVYNFGTESTQIRNEDNFDEIEAYTSEVSAFLKSQLSNFLTKRAMDKAERERAKAEAESKNGTKAEPETSAPADEEKIVYEPDHLFVAHAEAVEIPVLLEGEEDKVVVIEVKAETVVETWEIVLDNIEGLEYMSSAIAIISGQAESHYLGRKEDSEGEVSIYFEMDKDEENGRIIGKFNTFGKHPGEQSVLSLDVNVTDVNGGEQHYHFDIDSEFMDNPGMDITIEEPVVIEEPKSEGGGFAPSVEDWEEVRTEINL